jgi:hypothetical protein
MNAASEISELNSHIVRLTLPTTNATIVAST